MPAVFFPPWKDEGPSAPLATNCRSRSNGVPCAAMMIPVADMSRMPAMQALAAIATTAVIRVPLAPFDVATAIPDEMDAWSNQAGYLNFRPGKRRSDKPLSEVLRSQVFARFIFCIGVIYECSWDCSGEFSSYSTGR